MPQSGRLRQRIWFGNTPQHAVIVRNASFARFLPKLVVKFARIPALFGGLMVGGAAWVQYKAIQQVSSLAGCYCQGVGESHRHQVMDQR